MPLITIHTSNDEQEKFLSKILDELRIFTAKELSCGDRTLVPEEMSIRVSRSSLSKPIADIEIVIIAASYKERVDNQDKICLDIKKFLTKKCNNTYSFFIWLQLSELGHSA